MLCFYFYYFLFSYRRARVMVEKCSSQMQKKRCPQNVILIYGAHRASRVIFLKHQWYRGTQIFHTSPDWCSSKDRGIVCLVQIFGNSSKWMIQENTAVHFTPIFSISFSSPLIRCWGEIQKLYDNLLGPWKTHEILLYSKEKEKYFRQRKQHYRKKCKVYGWHWRTIMYLEKRVGVAGMAGGGVEGLGEWLNSTGEAGRGLVNCPGE